MLELDKSCGVATAMDSAWLDLFEGIEPSEPVAPLSRGDMAVLQPLQTPVLQIDACPDAEEGIDKCAPQEVRACFRFDGIGGSPVAALLFLGCRWRDASIA